MGCGRISASYAAAFRQLQETVQLICAVDIDILKAKAFAEPFGAAYGTCFEDLEKQQIDVLHLCLPHYLHAPMAVRAMQTGMHVLTEKPVAMTLQEADQMAKAAKQTEKKLGVIFQTRYEESVITLRRMIQEGAFGRILSARSFLTWNRPYSYYEGSDWKGTWEREGGGVLIDQAIHSIDRVRHMLGSEVEWIDGSIHNHCHDRLLVEDSAEAAIRFKNGCIYSLYACNSYADDVPIYLEFFGEKGRCGLRQDMGFYELDGKMHTIPVTTQTPDGASSATPSYWGESHPKQLLDFYTSVLSDTPVAVDVEEGRRTLEIIKGIYLSSLKRERIYLPFEDVKYCGLNQIQTQTP